VLFVIIVWEGLIWLKMLVGLEGMFEGFGLFLFFKFLGFEIV
jgi:hypothetical protein